MSDFTGVLIASKNWFVQLELYGGDSSLIGMIPSNATAFANRDVLWTFQVCPSFIFSTSATHRSQFYASSSTYRPPYPDEGFTFVDGLVSCITDHEPETYHYGYAMRLRGYYPVYPNASFHRAYPDYIDPRLTPDQWHTLYYGSK